MFDNEENIPSIVFFGTPEFAKFCLKYLNDNSFNIKGLSLHQTEEQEGVKMLIHHQ